MSSSSSHTFIHRMEVNSPQLPIGLCLACPDFEELYKTKNSLLHPSEQFYFQEMQYPKRQYSYLIGRYCAKKALRCVSQKEPRDISIQNGIFNQPLVNMVNQKISITHTETLGGALAFPESLPMGIDVESLSAEKEESVIALHTPHEYSTFLSCKPLYLGIMIWTIKEALSKALHCGMTVPMDVLEVATFKAQGSYFTSTFKNFSQYRGISFWLTNSVCTIVHPHNVNLSLNVLNIQLGEQQLAKAVGR